MSSDEESQDEDNALIFSSSPLRRTRTNAASARRQFQDPFEPLPLLPVNSGCDQVQSDGDLSRIPDQEERDFQPHMLAGRFQHELAHAPTYRHGHGSNRETFENKNTMAMAQYQSQTGNLPERQQDHDFEEYRSSGDMIKETQQQRFVMPEHGLHVHEHRHHNDGSLVYFPNSNSKKVDVTSTEYQARNVAAYSSSYSDDIHSKKSQKFSAHKESYSIDHSKEARQVHFTNERRRHEDEISTPQNFHREYGAQFSPLPYARGMQGANSDEKETSYQDARQIEMPTACNQQVSSPRKRMRRDEYFRQLESNDSNIGEEKIDRKKLKPHSSEETEGLKLVYPDDKTFSTKFSFATLCEITRCKFGPADMKGKRRGLSVGFPGLACQHCKGDSLNNGRFFPSEYQHLMIYF